MDVLALYTLAGAAVQLLVGIVVLASQGDLRLRVSLSALFLMNGLAQLALRVGGSDWGVPWRTLGTALDAPTGLILLDLGVVLALSRNAWQRGTGVVAAMSVPVFIAAGLWLDPAPRVVGDVAELSLVFGLLAVLIGTGLTADRHRTVAASVLLFAFAPRAIEFIVMMPAYAVAAPATSLASLIRNCWRIGYALAAIGVIGLGLRRHHLRRTLLLAIAIGLVAAAGQLAVPQFSVPLFAYFTLLVIRPLFVVTSMALAGPSDLLKMPPRDVTWRLSFGVGGLAAGYLAAEAIAPGTFGPLHILLPFAATLVGVSLAGFVTENVAAPHVEVAPESSRLRAGSTGVGMSRPIPEGLTQSERILIALQDVRIQTGRPAPYGSTAAGLSKATGIASRHIPMIVRRTNERAKAEGHGPSGFIRSEVGHVEGLSLTVPRYELTEAGLRAATALTATTEPSDHRAAPP